MLSATAAAVVLSPQRRYKLCWQTALAAAVAKVNQPALSAVYASKQPRGGAVKRAGFDSVR